MKKNMSTEGRKVSVLVPSRAGKADLQRGAPRPREVPEREAEPGLAVPARHEHLGAPAAKKIRSELKK